MKSIYDYLDYRKYLSDFFDYQRENSSCFSFRYAEKKIQVDASNLAKIVQGKRHIPPSSFDQFVSFLKLDPSQRDYLQLLIQFSRSRSEAKSRLYFEKIRSFNTVTATRISLDRYEFYQKWYYTAVLALIHFFPARRGEWDRIGKKLQPQISADQAKEAVALLERLGFVKVDTTGHFSHTDSIITSGEQWRSIALETFQRQTLALALQAMDDVPLEKRYISTLTVTLSEKQYTKIRDITAEFRRAILREVSSSDDSDTVYQINTQLFPLSREDL